MGTALAREITKYYQLTPNYCQMVKIGITDS